MSVKVKVGPLAAAQGLFALEIYTFRYSVYTLYTSMYKLYTLFKQNTLQKYIIYIVYFHTIYMLS